ncbi:MAG: hypothetical protein WBC91_18810 [Phototrophicaceae bacterium]
MDEQDMQYQDYKNPTSFMTRIIYAILGGMIGVIVWLGIVYFTDRIVYVFIILIGLIASSGARAWTDKEGSIAIAILSMVVTFMWIIIGDMGETALLLDDFSLNLSDYLDAFLTKIEDDPLRGIFYVLSLLGAGYFGFRTDS